MSRNSGKKRGYGRADLGRYPHPLYRRSLADLDSDPVSAEQQLMNTTLIFYA